MRNNERTRNVLRAAMLVTATVAGFAALWRALVNAESDAAYALSWITLAVMVTILAATLWLGVQVVRRHVARRRERLHNREESNDES